MTAPAPTVPGELYAIEFDHRSDGGPRLVGPFPNRGTADAYARNLKLREAAYCVCPMKTP